MTGAEITLSSSTMAKRWFTLARVTSAKRRAPTELKVKFTTQSPVSRVGAGAGVGQVSAVDVDALAHRDLLAGAVLHRQEVVAGRRRAAAGGVGGLVHQTERHVGGLADQLLDAVGVADAGKLHDDAALALAGDLGIDHAGLIDAAADDLDGLVDRAGSPCRECGAERVRVIVPSGSDPIAVSGRPVDASWLISGFIAATAASVLRGVAQAQQDAVLIRLRFQGLIEDLAVAQSLADAVGQTVQPLLQHRLHVDFEQQIAAAAQVEAEMHGAPRAATGRATGTGLARPAASQAGRHPG